MIEERKTNDREGKEEREGGSKEGRNGGREKESIDREDGLEI